MTTYSHFRTLLLILVFSVLLFPSVYSQDQLDKVNNSSHLIIELKDAYRAFHINNIILAQHELINVLLSDSTDTEANELLDKFINSCTSVTSIPFSNDTLHAYVGEYIARTIQSYRLAKSKGFVSMEFKTDYENYKTEKEKYMEYLYTTYSTGHFIKMTEKQYWKNNDKKNFIRSPQFAQYERMKKTNPNSGMKLLDSITKQTADFRELIVYEIESADQNVKHGSAESAIAKYKAILDARKYSIYLFESWLKWRVVTQQNIGLSKTSEIPNDGYDKMREQTALTILEYISKNQKDEMAINEFLLMATHDIVKRFGDYPYGNQNTVEYHELFDEKK